MEILLSKNLQTLSELTAVEKSSKILTTVAKLSKRLMKYPATIRMRNVPDGPDNEGPTKVVLIGGVTPFVLKLTYLSTQDKYKMEKGEIDTEYDYVLLKDKVDKFPDSPSGRVNPYPHISKFKKTFEEILDMAKQAPAVEVEAASVQAEKISPEMSELTIRVDSVGVAISTLLGTVQQHINNSAYKLSVPKAINIVYQELQELGTLLGLAVDDKKASARAADESEFSQRVHHVPLHTYPGQCQKKGNYSGDYSMQWMDIRLPHSNERHACDEESDSDKIRISHIQNYVTQFEKESGKQFFIVRGHQHGSQFPVKLLDQQQGIPSTEIPEWAPDISDPDHCRVPAEKIVANTLTFTSCSKYTAGGPGHGFGVWDGENWSAYWDRSQQDDEFYKEYTPTYRSLSWTEKWSDLLDTLSKSTPVQPRPKEPTPE